MKLFWTQYCLEFGKVRENPSTPIQINLKIPFDQIPQQSVNCDLKAQKQQNQQIYGKRKKAEGKMRVLFNFVAK